MEIFLNRGWDLTLPGWRWLHEPQPISNQPVGSGFPHCAGRCRPEKPPLSSLGVLELQKYMEVFLLRGLDHIFPGWHWLHEPQPINNQPVGMGFPPRAGWYRPEGPSISSPACWSCKCMEGFMIRG